jgi:hypothetical protein
MLLEDFGSRIYLLEFSSVNEAWLYNFKYDAHAMCFISLEFEYTTKTIYLYSQTKLLLF